MSNIAGKAYAMNLITPIQGWMVPVNKIIFWALDLPFLASNLRGLLTLSLIHYARWVIVTGSQFPRLSESQPPENLKYAYMFFFSNFNGTWEQYVDSFSAAIPSGLNALWYQNVGWPTAVPEQPFHRYVQRNQVTTDHYYNAYPMAASNDVKAAQRVKDALCALAGRCRDLAPDDFMAQYDRLLKDLQQDLSPMDASPIVSLATAAIAARRADDRSSGASPTPAGEGASGRHEIGRRAVHPAA
jgi:hypothetical protein